MGNNTLKSLIVATSMFAAWSHAEWTSNKVDETKRAIQELISSLDASKYGAARGVLGWDEALLADGDISQQDKEIVELHAKKLLQIAPEKAKAVLDALDGNNPANNGEQVQAEVGRAPQIPIKPKPQLGSKEAAEARKIEKLRDDSLEIANKNLWKSENWKIDPTNPGIKISKKDGGLVFNYEPKVKNSGSQIWTAYFQFSLVAGTYEVELMDDTINLRLWLFEKNESEPIKTDGTPWKEVTRISAPPLKTWEKRTYPVKIPIIVPGVSAKQQLNLDVSPNNLSALLWKDSVKIIKVPEKINELAAGK